MKNEFGIGKRKEKSKEENDKKYKMNVSKNAKKK